MARAIASFVLVAACGRIGFDVHDDLAITPLTARTNLNSFVAFSASGGVPPYAFSIDTGAGSIDPQGGRYFAPSTAGTAAIRVTDQLGDSRVAQVTFGGDVLWYVGGRILATSEPRAEVWRSDDGATWTPADSLPVPVADGAAVVFDDRMWLIGGVHVAGMYAGDVYSSRDGVTWELAGTSVPSPCLGEPHAAVHERRMWIVRGGCIYASDDGVTWIEEGTFSAMTHAGQVVSFADALYYAGGHDTTVHDAVYRSADGATWASVGALPSPRFLHGMAVFVGRLWVVGGASATVPLADVGVSDDGVTWTTVAPLPVARDGLNAIAFGDRLLVIGGRATPVYATTDGTAWTQIGTLPAARFAGQVFAFTPP